MLRCLVPKLLIDVTSVSLVGCRCRLLFVQVPVFLQQCLEVKVVEAHGRALFSCLRGSLVLLPLLFAFVGMLIMVGRPLPLTFFIRESEGIFETIFDHECKDPYCED